MKILLFFLFIINLDIVAQIDDPLKYFPYKTGDMWEYYLYDLQYPDTSQTFNIMDSTDTQGNIYVKQISRRINPIQPPFLFPDTAIYIIDTSFNVLAPAGWPIENYYIKYKLNANQGEQWVIFDYSQVGGSGYEMVRLREVWEDELFAGSGIYTTFKAFSYFYASDSTDTLGLDRYGDVLSKGFGLWSRGGGDTFGDWYLKGCVINDTLYGDTTNVITSLEDNGLNIFSFELLQNYPNPFNPATTIEFELPAEAYGSVNIYSILGENITTLFTGQLRSGTHKYVWNAYGFSSGIYLCRVNVNGKTRTIKMLLAK
jgi:hypothetical protein